MEKTSNKEEGQTDLSEAEYPEKSYIGWIPTISGKLFYENWGCSRELGKLFHRRHSIRQIGNDRVRRVILSSTVDWRDQRKGDGNFKVILSAEGEISEDKVTGKIYIFPQEFVSFFSAGAKKKESLVNITKLISNLSKRHINKKDMTSDYNTIITNLGEIEEEEFYVVDFSINRRGFVKVNLNEQTYNNKTLTVRTPEVICRQAFYFIKYSLHQHQHHDSKDDSLTEIHLLSSDIGMEMIEDLKRALVSMKRDFGNLGHYCLFNASGIVAYTKSLAKSSLLEGYIDEKTYEREIVYLDNISLSLNKIAENEERIISKKEALSNKFRSLLLLFLAIVAPLTIIFKDEILKAIQANGSQYNSTVNILSSVYGNAPTYILAIIGLLVTIASLGMVMKSFSGKTISNYIIQILSFLLKTKVVRYGSLILFIIAFVIMAKKVISLFP